MVVIDYLQLISFENIKIEEKKTIEILKILKSLATDLNICIVVLHQFGAKESLVEENIKSNNLNQMAIFSKYGNLVFCEPDNKMEYDYAENIIIIKNQ